MLGKLFRRLFLTRLFALHEAGWLAFGAMAHLANRRAFLHHLKPVRSKCWVVYAKDSCGQFGGPQCGRSASHWNYPQVDVAPRESRPGQCLYLDVSLPADPVDIHINRYIWTKLCPPWQPSDRRPAWTTPGFLSRHARKVYSRETLASA